MQKVDPRTLPKLKKATTVLAEGFACTRNVTSAKKLTDDVETFVHLGNASNTSGGFETTVVARTRIGRMSFRECGEVLYGRRLSSKGKVYLICVRSTILCGSKTWRFN